MHTYMHNCLLYVWVMILLQVGAGDVIQSKYTEALNFWLGVVVGVPLDKHEVGVNHII